MSHWSQVALPRANVILKCTDCHKYRSNILVCLICSMGLGLKYHVCQRCRRAHEAMDELKELGKNEMAKGT